MGFTRLKTQNDNLYLLLPMHSLGILSSNKRKNKAGGQYNNAYVYNKNGALKKQDIDKFSIAVIIGTFMIFIITSVGFQYSGINIVSRAFAYSEPQTLPYIDITLGGEIREPFSLIVLDKKPEPPIFNNRVSGANIRVSQNKNTTLPITPKQYRVKSKIVVPMTAYSSTVDQTDSTPFIMASNKRVYSGAVAANFLPFGTKVRIPGYFGNRIFTVEDRMNKRYWRRVDIWMQTRQEALNFGLRNLEVEILEEVYV